MKMAQSEAHKNWVKENTVFIGIRLQKKTDEDILSFLRSNVNEEKKIGTQTIIKAALREYIANHKEEEEK